MHRAILQFESNLESARQLGVIFASFSDKVTEAIRLDELLRAEIVLAVSALDCYVHDVVRIGMTKALSVASGEPNAFLKFGVSMQFVKRVIHTTSSADRKTLFDQEIRRLHGFKTFQNAENISQALSFLGVKGVWDSIGAGLGMPSSDVKTRLNLIIERRNGIAHEGDIDPSLGIAAKYPIDLSTVQQTVDFLDSVARQMQIVVVRDVTY